MDLSNFYLFKYIDEFGKVVLLDKPFPQPGFPARHPLSAIISS